MTRLNQPQSSSLLETTDFLLLQSLMRNESSLKFELALSPASPLQIYRQLLSLASELGAVQHPPVRVTSPAEWDANALIRYFPPILQTLRDMLSNMRERLALELNLRSSADGIYASEKALPALGAGDRIVIAVQAKVPEDWFWTRFNGQVIVSAGDKLADRVRLQMKGVELKHLSTTPPELPLQTGWHYFELRQDNEPWREITQTLSLSLHVAGQWPGFSIRAWVLQSTPKRRTQHG
jgi:type VI secretion system protein ImpJ